MIDSYVIFNREPRIIIKVFICHIFLLLIIVIYGINTLYYQKSIQFHSQVLNLNSFYYLKVLVPVKEVNEVTSHTFLWIDSRKYFYRVIDVGDNVTYLNKTNNVYIYLEVLKLEKEFLVNGYHLDISIKSDSKKIIDYFKNKKEEYNEEDF